ncbi:MAG: peptidylprolyl isomerase [Xanthomonadales bacterium]|nr:peptidylprolyl isomerase [Xanthomonadales bacterium]
MQVAKDRVVTLHYRLKLEDGSTLESSEGKEPLVYLHGTGNIIAGLEKGLEGKTAEDDEVSITVTPAEAYGEYNPELQMRMPIKNLKSQGKLKANTMAVIETEEGPRQVMVIKVGRFHADVDANHPLSGQTLVFEVNIDSVREASAEEIEHGHVHGPGGHQH